MATDLFSGSQQVSWGNGLQITADKFADAKAGDKLVVTYAAGATDGIEFKVINEHFDHLAGSREAAGITGTTSFEQFLTPAAVEGLKTYGLEIIGANFTATKVELLDGKAELKEGYTVWTGFFFANDWTTLELYRDAYCNVDMSKYAAIRFYSESKNGDYILNFLKGWNEGEKFAGEQDMTDGEGYKELALTNDLRKAISEAGHWMIQYSVNWDEHKGDPFNVTDIVLVEAGATAISNVNDNDNRNVRKVVENGQIVIIKNGVRYNAVGAAL